VVIGRLKSMKKIKRKLDFICNQGLYEFNVMPFGLTNAPATFQQMMDEVISGIDWTVGVDYLDDIMIGFKTFESHLKDIAAFFQKT
jgi:hypothetical protein